MYIILGNTHYFCGINLLAKLGLWFFNCSIKSAKNHNIASIPNKKETDIFSLCQIKILFYVVLRILFNNLFRFFMETDNKTQIFFNFIAFRSSMIPLINSNIFWLHYILKHTIHNIVVVKQIKHVNCFYNPN